MAMGIAVQVLEVDWFDRRVTTLVNYKEEGRK